MLKIKKYQAFVPVYDITVEKTHNFFANNILIHNCVEVLQHTIASEKWNDDKALIGVCILGGINAIKVKTDEEFEEACLVLVRALDNLTSLQSYFDLAAENFAKKYRSLGIGCMNFAAYMAENKMFYSNSKAPDFAAQFAEKLSFYSIKASIELAKERGKFEYFDKTKWSKGLLPIDRYNKAIDPFVTEPKMDWDSLREDLAKYGIRHSTLTAYMPVESSSVVSGSTSGLEPIRDYIVSKSSKAGKVLVVAPKLKENRAYYSLAFDAMTNDDLLKIYAAINKFTCMGISANTYLNVEHFDNRQIPLSVVVKDVFNYFKLGGRTLYYNNTEENSGSKYEEKETCSAGGCSL